MKLAIVHDWLKNISGAERVLIELHKIFPEAPIYTLFYNKRFIQKWLPNADIRASFLQKIPLIARVYSLFAFLMPTAIESFDLSDFDTVLSSSVIFSKGLILKPSTKHICYCYSPTRFLWDRNFSDQSRRFGRLPDSLTSGFSIFNFQWPRKIFKHFLRLWDRAAADRVDQFVAISKTVQDRIKKYYRRESIIIYPPASFLTPDSTDNRSAPAADRHLDSRRFTKRQAEPPARLLAGSQKLRLNDYYLIVARLHSYKNIDIAIKAFNKLNYPLVIIGDGPDKKRLERLANKNITFLGEQDDSTLIEYYRACRAFIMPQEEDFGLTPIEAMSFGKPVVALCKGGALETIVEGQTGEFFDDPIPEALADAIRRLNENYTGYNPKTIKARASIFDVEKFKEAIIKLVT